MSTLNPLWQDTEFDSIFYVEKGVKKKQIQTKDYLPLGKFPIIDQGKEQIVAYSNDVEKLYASTPVIVFGDHTRILKYITFPFVVGADGTQLLKVKNNFSLRFCFYLLQNTKIENLGYSRHMSLLKEKVFTLPPLPEQEKIAEILGTWDLAIEKLTALIEQKKLLKKGLMQRLLTGKQRLPGFSTPWKKFEFDQMALLNNKKYIPNQNEHLKCLELEHFEKETGCLIGYVDSAEQSSTKNVFKSGDVLFGKLRPYLKKYTKPDFNGVCSTEIWVLSGSDYCANDYLYLLIQSTKFLSACNVSSGTHMPRADWDFVSHIPFFIPSLLEQKAIADILSKADEEITLLTRKLSALKEQKTGLMQKLLTGQIRVKVA